MSFSSWSEAVAEILGSDHVGESEPDGGQLPGEELGVVLGPGRHLPVPLDNGAVPVVLPVLGEQDQRRRVGGLGGERQVEQDEGVRVPVLDQADGVEHDPPDDQDALADQEPAGAQEPGDPLGDPPEGVVVVRGADARGGAPRSGQVASVAQAQR